MDHMKKKLHAINGDCLKVSAKRGDVQTTKTTPYAAPKADDFIKRYDESLCVQLARQSEVTV